MFQKQIERCRKEAGVLWLEDKVIVAFGFQQFDDWLTARIVIQTMRNQLLEIRSPLAEVVINVNGRNARAAAALLERGNSLRRRQCVSQEFGATFKLKVVDDVD